MPRRAGFALTVADAQLTNAIDPWRPLVEPVMAQLVVQPQARLLR